MSKYLSNEIEFLFNRKTNINLLVSNKTCTAPQCAGSDFQARHHKHRPIMTMTVHSSFYFSSFLFAFVRVRMDKIKSHLFIWGSADCNRNLIPAPKVQECNIRVRQRKFLFYILITGTRKSHTIGRGLISLTTTISSWTMYPIEQLQGFRCHHVNFCILLVHQISELLRLLRLLDL